MTPVAASRLRSPANANAHSGFSQLPTSLLSTLRELVFGGSVPLCIRLGEREQVSGDKVVEAYYVQAPRISYLPILLADIRKHFLDLILDEATAATLNIDNLWLKVAGSDEPVRWHWPIGLLYDYHTVNTTFISAKSAKMPAQAGDIGQPLQLTLHLRDPPLEKIPIGPSLDACRSNFMNMVKEADFVRWGSTRRVTALRKVDQDALWEGIVRRDFDAFWAVGNKLIPSPFTNGISSSPVERSISGQSAKSAASTSGATSTLSGDRLPDTASMRSVPLRIYLPENIPILQDVVPPLDSDGNAVDLYTVLSNQISLAFPPRSSSMAGSSVANRAVGRAIIQGVQIPLNAEVGFLSSCFSGPDGWLHVVVQFDAKK